eukprot:s752_g5.t1
MDAYNRHVQLTKSLLVKAAAELKVATDEPLTRAMQKTVSDAAKKQWAKRKQGDESAEEAADGSSTKAKAAPKKKASAKRKAKNLAEATEAPASMEHPVDRMNAELRAFDDDKGQVFDASKKTWGRVSDELRAKLKPLVYKLEKPLEQI